jgi:hypothetical protein
MNVQIPEKMTVNISKTANKKYNKFKSTKLWLTVWATSILTQRVTTALPGIIRRKL